MGLRVWVAGMSNRYWGWGLEDDEFYLRLREGGIELRRPLNLSTDRTTTFMHVHDRRLRKRDTLRIGDQKQVLSQLDVGGRRWTGAGQREWAQVSRRRDRLSGLDSVGFEVLSRSQLGVDGAPASVLNLRLHCNLSFSPWCQLPAAYS